MTFDVSKTKLLSFNQQQEFALVPLEMNVIELHESSSFHLFVLVFTDVMDWKPYILFISKAASRKLAPYRSQRERERERERVSSFCTYYINPQFNTVLS